MASRRFFAYDPYDYYTTTPYQYPYPYYHHQSAPDRSAGGFFPNAADTKPVARAAARTRAGSSRSVSIPVHFVGSDPKTERETARMPAPAAVPRKQVLSEEKAAVKLQAAARGFLARKTVRAVREVEREAEEVARRVAREAEAPRVDARTRIAVGEELMRLLLRLDAVRGAREYRRRVTKKVLALQDAVDALEPRLAPAPTAVAEKPDTADVSPAVEMAEMAPELPEAAEHGGETEPKTAAEMGVDGGRAACEPDAAEETELAQDGANLEADRLVNADAEGEWEMVTEEPGPAASSEAAPRPQEPAGEEIRRTAEAGAADALDARKVMEMVAKLCERSAQQCALIGALAERVNALERAVRLVENAEQRRRRGKKLRKEGRGSNHRKYYSE